MNQRCKGGFVLFPKEAPWLDTYLNELVTFRNAKNDDQVDSTVFTLAWSTPSGGAEGWIEYARREAERSSSYRSEKKNKIPVRVAPPTTQLHLNTGRYISFVPENRIVEMTEEELRPLINLGARRVD